MKNLNFLNNALGGCKIEKKNSNNVLGGGKIEMFLNNALKGGKIEIYVKTLE